MELEGISESLPAPHLLDAKQEEADDGQGHLAQGMPQVVFPFHAREN